MEEEQIENNNQEPSEVNGIEKEELPVVEQNPFELISEKLKEQDEKIINCIGYIKTLNEEIKMLKSNFKLLLEEKE